MILVIAIVASSITVLIALVIAVIAILELRQDTNEQRAFIEKQSEWMRKSLERNNP